MTEYPSSPRMSLKVKAGAFVNLSGREGHNKAADVHKENAVKELKKAMTERTSSSEWQSYRPCTFCKHKTRGKTQFWIELTDPYTLANHY